jgi:hypothetical protein
MFTPEERTQLRDALIAAARADPRLTGAALTGSAAGGAEDRWSDVDLAFGVAAEADPGRVIADWTNRMYQGCGAVHHLDVYRGDTVFRVFLLASTLQVDLAFWPAAEFGAVGPTFRLLARSSIARGRPWQAEYMISGMRDQVLALACLRHGAPAVEGRGIDALPPEATAAVAAGLVRSLDAAELRRAFAAVTDALIAEAGRADAGLADRLRAPLKELTADS